MIFAAPCHLRFSVRGRDAQRCDTRAGDAWGRGLPLGDVLEGAVFEDGVLAGRAEATRGIVVRRVGVCRSGRQAREVFGGRAHRPLVGVVRRGLGLPSSLRRRTRRGSSLSCRLSSHLLP